jgi:hypothetical protein
LSDILVWGVKNELFFCAFYFSLYKTKPMSTTTDAPKAGPTMYQQIAAGGKAIANSQAVVSAQAKAGALLERAKAGGKSGMGKLGNWLKVYENQSISLFTLLFIMIIVNFAVFMSIDFEKLRNSNATDDAEEVAKLAHLKNISIVTILLACGVAVFEVINYRSATMSPITLGDMSI